MADFSLKRGDTAIPLTAILSDGTGPLDLTGITVRFKMRGATLSTTKVDSPAVPDPDQITNKGKVKYEWADSDVDTPGNFVGEFKLFSGGKPLTFPNGSNYIQIEIGTGVKDILP
jgi:hypothetical protein